MPTTPPPMPTTPTILPQPTTTPPSTTITLAWTGASGIAYGVRLLECLLKAAVEVRLVYSEASEVVLKEELGITLPKPLDAVAPFLREHCKTNTGVLRVFSLKDWFSPIASGSNPSAAMVICPCSMGTLASIAHGLSSNLIERAADVALKERRPLIMVARETPLSRIHLQNMLSLTDAGASILPASPGFYRRPKDVSDLIDFMVARILDQLKIPHTLFSRWGGTEPTSSDAPS